MTNNEGNSKKARTLPFFFDPDLLVVCECKKNFHDLFLTFLVVWACWVFEA